MTHPEELLADYVDGTLSDDQRAVVDAHLQGCATCREEVELGRAALAALDTLRDEPVPFGVTGPVLAEAGRSFERRRGALVDRLQWAAGLAAAAALVLVVALNIGGSNGESPAAIEAATSAEGGADAAAPEAGAPQGELGFMFRGLEDQAGVDYDEAGIQALAEDAAPVVRGEAAFASADQAASQRAADDAVACIERSGAPTADDPRDTLVRLLAAEYQGTPAYIAVYAEGPGADQPADRIVVWAADQETCTFLTAASLPI